ncbi:hypothetical protein ME763_18095 [Streptomyces murinus]|uniref:hypothetical protein n=1 Tax=Streptomyces murinus TaxID=33900 RepID=UPI001556F3DB|nr:hypothetical protein [Streptomyces murinus]WDO07422.1 hypothetical protein ME763_18095 [Streptomyces murinus]
MTSRPIRLALSMCAAALATTGCGSSPHGTASPTPAHPARLTAPSAPTEPSDTPPTPPGPSVHQAPLTASDGIKVLASGTAVKGDATYPIPGGIKAGRTLAIAINCAGPGRLTVQVRSAGISFSLRCTKDEVLPSMNEIQVPRTHSTGSLHFTADPDVTWSFTIGWNPNPPERR